MIVELSLLVDASLKPAWPKPSLGKNARLGKSTSLITSDDMLRVA